VPWSWFAVEWIYSLAWAVFTPFVFRIVARWPVSRSRWIRALLFHLGAGTGFGVLYFAFAAATRPAMGVLLDEPMLLRELTWSFPFRVIVTGLMIYAEVAAVGHGIHYYRQARAEERRAARLEAQLAQAQLEVLRMQLHPHFLFNTLHTISSLMHTDLKAADRMLALLADLLRDSFEKVGAQEVSLKQELEFLDRYLEIERTRFRDRLVLARAVEPELLDARVPNLILQPIVENAIRHGIARRAGRGRIEIAARQRGDELELLVRDDGPGLPDGVPLRGGVGLANTQARLTQLYGQRHRFELRDRPEGGLEVVVAVPLVLEPAGPAAATPGLERGSQRAGAPAPLATSPHA
jgi:two-component sensor histidine kinase